jgi:hypothetical protein
MFVTCYIGSYLTCGEPPGGDSSINYVSLKMFTFSISEIRVSALKRSTDSCTGKVVYCGDWSPRVVRSDPAGSLGGS